MEGTDSDDIKVLPAQSQRRSSLSSNAVHPSRPIRFLTGRKLRKQEARSNSNAAFVQEMDTVDEPTAASPSSDYGYLGHIQSFKPKLTPDDKSLPKKVR
jgi:hypothetical protein